jgi:hypothetical protein
MKQTREWSTRVTADIGKRVAWHRARADLTVQALSERCAELGLPLGRVVLSKLELGLRQTLNVGELLVLAHALDVSPAVLIFPLGHKDEVEVLPGQTLSPWDAVKWLSGAARLEKSRDGLQAALPSHRSPVVLFREHEQYSARLAGHSREDTWGRSETAMLLRTTQVALQSTRETLGEMGFMPPPLPEELGWIDEEEF